MSTPQIHAQLVYLTAQKIIVNGVTDINSLKIELCVYFSPSQPVWVCININTSFINTWTHGYTDFFKLHPKNISTDFVFSHSLRVGIKVLQKSLNTYHPKTVILKENNMGRVFQTIRPQNLTQISNPLRMAQKYCYNSKKLTEKIDGFKEFSLRFRLFLPDHQVVKILAP